MNLDSLSFTLSQISYLVANLSKKNYEDSCREISGVSIHGRDAVGFTFCLVPSPTFLSEIANHPSFSSPLSFSPYASDLLKVLYELPFPSLSPADRDFPRDTKRDVLSSAS